MKYKFFDTSSLLLLESWTDNYKIAISTVTLQELENLKSSRDSNKKYLARQATKMLSKHLDQFEIVIFTQDMLTPFIQRDLEITNDIKILASAFYLDSLYPDEVTFVTNDLALRNIANLFFGEDSIESIEVPDEEYKGFEDVMLTDAELEYFYSHLEENQFGLYINEYLIIRNTEGEIIDWSCWNGKTHRCLRYRDMTSKQFGKVRPLSGDIWQQFAVDSFNNNKITLLTGRAGSGKAQPNSTLIPTKKGYKKLGDIKVGDKILDRLGKETTVLGVFPQGLKENYKITFSDGRIAFCNNEHLWSCYTSKGNLKTFTVQQMINSGLQTNGKHWRYQIPVAEPIEYEEKKYEIDPYVIGVFLGDGCCKEKPLTLSSNDEEIVKEVATLIGAASYRKNSKFNYNWHFQLSEKDQYFNSGNVKVLNFQTEKFFTKYKDNLICSAQQKSIPEEYKFGSISQRLALIQGLMDTDGTIDNEKKGRTRFTSTSIKLIQDLQEICWSLGMSAGISKDSRKDKYTNGACYNLTISCKKENKPNLFRLKRKKDIAIKYSNNNIKSIYSNKITIKEIEKMPHLEEMTCLYVDNDEHLYLTEQYIVTHNTFLSLSYLVQQLEQGMIDKIVIFCNPVAVRGAARLGFYAGDKLQKLLDSQIGNFLVSKFGGMYEVERLIQQEKLLLLPVSDLRGFDTTGLRAGVYITEAQNMSVDLMKLALQRIGEDCICIIEGDNKTQVDMEEYAGQNNGMRRMSEVFRGQDYFGQVELQLIHRSRIAKTAELM